MKSTKPSKQRKAIYDAPLHKRQKLVHAHLTKELRKQYKKRNLGLRKGDEVKILRGDFRGKTGKVTKINLKDLQVFIEGIKRKKTTGEETEVPFQPSNLMIMNLSMDDARRKKVIEKVK
ncbi:MAG: 50S ribosomal protein L24 [Candidatus Aenigmarchaeota archaeon]|nr:50S ribosomal protein L24 [Candidatus Aenigmarchaeota archaeon]